MAYPIAQELVGGTLTLLGSYLGRRYEGLSGVSQGQLSVLLLFMWVPVAPLLLGSFSLLFNLWVLFAGLVRARALRIEHGGGRAGGADGRADGRGRGGHASGLDHLDMACERFEAKVAADSTTLLTTTPKPPRPNPASPLDPPEPPLTTP